VRKDNSTWRLHELKSWDYNAHRMFKNDQKVVVTQNLFWKEVLPWSHVYSLEHLHAELWSLGFSLCLVGSQ
jgi:hypothetical protein